MATNLKSVKAAALTSVLTTAGVSATPKITSLAYSGVTIGANITGGETLTITGAVPFHLTDLGYTVFTLFAEARPHNLSGFFVRQRT